MKPRQFLEELALLRAETRRQIEAHQSGLDASPAAVAERRRRVLSGDFAFFAYHYFPHHVRGEPSRFQAHFCQRFPQLLRRDRGAKEWWVAPRGEAKSSLATKIGPLWCAVQALLQREAVRTEIGWSGPAPYFIDYVVLLGAETRLPTKLMEVVKTELTVNAALALDFPEVCGRGPKWKVGELVTKTGVKVEPFGAEQAIRGTFHGAARPKLLLGDDLITDKEAKSATERGNRWDWLEKAIDYLGPPDGSVKYIGVGTVLHRDDPISRAKAAIGHVVHHFRAIEHLPARMDLWAQCEELMRNEDVRAERAAADAGADLPEPELPSYRFYAALRAEMDADALTSWPAVRSLYWLMRQRAKNARAFASEMQGDPRADEDRVFDPRFWVMKANDWVYFGACDPSVGKNERNDPSAILVGGWSRARLQLHVVHAAIKRRLLSKLEADLVAAQREYRCQCIGFESNGAFELVRQGLVSAGLRAGVPLPLRGITTNVDMSIHIDGLEPFVTGIDPRLLFSPGLTQLLDELDTWPEPQTHHHYDGLSALALLWMLATSGAGGPVESHRVSPERSGRGPGTW